MPEISQEILCGSSNLLEGIRIKDLFLATRRKLVADNVSPLTAINLTGVGTPSVGSTGAMLEFPNGDMFDCIIITGLNTGKAIYQIPAKDTISGIALQTGKTVVINNVGLEPETATTKLARFFGVSSCMSTPVHHGGVCMAILSVYAPTEEAFPPEVVQAVKVIATMFGAILGAAIDLSDAELAELRGTPIVKPWENTDEN